jgi:lipopolysaccharide biosynthesis protein
MKLMISSILSCHTPENSRLLHEVEKVTSYVCIVALEKLSSTHAAAKPKVKMFHAINRVHICNH